MEFKGYRILNIHNYTQIKYTFDNTLYDVSTNTEIDREIARLYLTARHVRIREYTRICADLNTEMPLESWLAVLSL